MDSFKTSLLTSKKIIGFNHPEKKKERDPLKETKFLISVDSKRPFRCKTGIGYDGTVSCKVNIHTDLLLQKAQGSTWHKALKALKDTTLLQVKSFSLTSLKNTHRYTKKWFCPKTTFHDWGETRKGQIYGIPHCFTWKFLLTRVAKRRAIPPSQDINGHIAKCQQKKCHATSDKDKRNRPSNKNVVWSTESK